jgi:hypothetical protein
MPSYEYRDGELIEVPDVVVSESGELREDVSRTLVIEPGIILTAHGRLSGSVSVRVGATLDARNDVSGTVNVRANADATFHRAASGTLNISRGGVVTLTKSAVALGTMHVDGTLINYGTRGVNVHGAGFVDDREGSTVRRPDETLDDGTVIYRN